MITLARLGSISPIIITVGIIIISAVFILVFYNLFSKGGLRAEDLVKLVADDLMHYTNALFSLDSGVKYYEMPQKVKIKTEAKSIEVSKDSVSRKINVIGELEKKELETDSICLVKDSNTGKISIYDTSLDDSPCQIE